MIQNTATGNQSLYEIDRIAKHSAALRCIGKKFVCICRLSWKVFADFGGNNYTDFLLVGKGQDEDPRPEVTQSLRNKSIIDTVSLIPGAPMWLNMALE